MSLAMKLVCNECGFEFENDGTDMFYVDADCGIFDHRVMLREEDPSLNALIKGDTFESYCGHCNRNVKTYSIREFGDYEIEEACQIVLDALKGRPDNIKLSARQKHRYFLSTIFEVEIKDMVEDRIVSISQPYVRPIVRGKAKSPVEFGAKLDLSVDENGMSRIEKLSFDAYNENGVLTTAIENYKERTGHYPERVLADQIYRNKDNISFCTRHGIRLSGKRLGRPKKNVDTAARKKTEHKDNTDRIEVERKFSLAKRKFGLGLLVTKREDTTKSSIVLSVIAMNIDRLMAMFLRHFFRALNLLSPSCNFLLILEH